MNRTLVSRPALWSQFVRVRPLKHAQRRTFADVSQDSRWDPVDLDQVFSFLTHFKQTVRCCRYRRRPCWLRSICRRCTVRSENRTHHSEARQYRSLLLQSEFWRHREGHNVERDRCIRWCCRSYNRQSWCPIQGSE